MIFSDPVNEFHAAGPHHQYLSLCPTMPRTSAAGTTSSSAFTGSRCACGLTTLRAWCPPTASPWDSGQPALTARDCPASAATIWPTPTRCWPRWAAIIDSYSQTFNVTSRTSGYVPGAPFVRHFLHERLRLLRAGQMEACRPRLTLTLGLRYELPGVVDERDSLELAAGASGHAEQTLLSNATLNFAGRSGRAIPGITAIQGFRPQYRGCLGRFRRRQDGGARRLFHLLCQRPGDLWRPKTMLEANSGLQGISADTGLVQPRLHRPAGDRSARLTRCPSPWRRTTPATRSTPWALIDPNLHRPLRPAVFLRHPA